MEKYLEQIEKIIKQGPYKDNWESLSEWEAPRWFSKKSWYFYSLGTLQCTGEF